MMMVQDCFSHRAFSVCCCCWCCFNFVVWCFFFASFAFVHLVAALVYMHFVNYKSIRKRHISYTNCLLFVALRKATKKNNEQMIELGVPRRKTRRDLACKITDLGQIRTKSESFTNGQYNLKRCVSSYTISKACP